MRVPTIRALSLCAAVLACGCDDDERRAASRPPPSDEGSAPGALVAPPPGRGEQLTIDAALAPGEEDTYCRYYFLDEVEVSRFEHAYTPGSHHVIIMPTDFTAADVPTLERFQCRTSSMPELGARGMAYVGQIPRGGAAMPDGVALEFPAGKAVLLQAHYLNATQGALDAHVAVNLWRPERAVTQHAGTIFFYNYGVYLPPSAATVARMRCTLPQDITLLAGMSHMHQHGVGYDSALVGAPLTQPLQLYTQDAWEDVPFQVFNPAVPIRTGQSVEFQCEYQNTGTRPVIDGPSAVDDEMCVFIGLYYPKLDDDTERCLRDGSGPLFSGASACGEALSCYRGARDREEGQVCLNSTCEPSSLALDDLYRCLVAECGSICPGGGESCDSCLAARCEAQGRACAVAKCE